MRAASTLIYIVLSCAAPLCAQQVLEDAVIIPRDLKITPDHLTQLPMIERQYSLAELEESKPYQIFEAPPCMVGDFYMAFQLVYDFGDRNTDSTTKAGLVLTLLHNDQRQWTKNLKVDMNDQVVLSTVFHDVPVSCDKDYKFEILAKNVQSAPDDNIYIRILLFKVDSQPFDFSSPLAVDVASTDEENSIVWSYDGRSGCEYDVEWVFVDRYSRFEGIGQHTFNHFEPVRVTTTNTYFNHHISYPAGQMHYRVRAVSKGNDGNRLTGDWFYSEPVTVRSPFESSSFIAQTTFGHDGTFQKSVTYQDSRQKDRQKLVLNSDEKFSVATEYFYDFEGRRAVEVLPAPLTGRTLKLQSSLNTFEAVDPFVRAYANGPLHKFHYDNGSSDNSVLSSKSGSSQYYSPLNDMDLPLADGEGYVYKQNVYSNDALESATLILAGKDLRSDGNHAPLVFKGHAGREEVVRLVGHEAMQQSLSKQLVVDENGTAEIRYVDEKERVVIKASLGDHSSAADPVRIDLLQNKEGDFVLLNSKRGTTFDFSYSASFDHLVNFALRITRPSGETMPLPLPENESVDPSQFRMDTVAASDLSSLRFRLTFDELGEYTISRTITPIVPSPSEWMETILRSPDFSKTSDSISAHFEIDSLTYWSHSLTADQKVAYYAELSDKAIDAELENLYDRMCHDFRTRRSLPVSIAVEEDSLHDHPLYDTYLFMKSNQKSESFDLFLNKIPSWEEADSFGLTDAVNKDPFFNDKSQGGYYLKEDMHGRLSNIVLASLIQDGDTLQLKGPIYDVIDPTNKSFYVNAVGLPDRETGIHPLYLELLTYRNKMSQEDYQAALLEKQWVLYRTFYLNAKREVISEALNRPNAQGKHQVHDTLSIGKYADNFISVMEWTFNKSFSEEDRMSIRMHLDQYFLTDSDNFLHVIQEKDINVHPDLLAIQSTLNKYGSDLSYVSQDDKLSCWNGELLEGLDPETHVVEAEQVKSSHSLEESQRVNANDVDSSTTNQVSGGEKIQMPWVGHSMTSAITPAEEFHALRVLYDKLGGANWKNNTGWRTASAKQGSVSNWFGIITNSQGRVIAIKLPDNNLKGVLPEEIGVFSELQFLDLGSLAKGANRISGIIPNSLGRLSKLVYLDLENNELTGSIPSPLYSLVNLRTLNLAGNRLTGSLSSEVAKLRLLTSLLLSGNKLTNSIPSEIGSLSNLKHLDLSRNEISYSIPATIGNLSQLVKLDLSHNKLRSSIPPTLGSLKKLQFLRLNNNRLQDEIPKALNSMSTLLQLDISFNHLTGNVPALKGLSSLLHFMAHNNRLSGGVPAEIGSLPNLKSLNLSKNELTGEIPSALWASKSLEHLDLSTNKLTGNLPSSSSATSKLQKVALSENQLTGHLPASLGEMRALTELTVHHNAFSGTLENISSLRNLKVLQAGHNKLEGKIPASLGELKQLEVLMLESNQLADTIPGALANATRLKRVDLSKNNLTGPIPATLGSLTDLRELTLSDNKLTGSIPASLDGVRRLVVSNNQLQGTLPAFLSERQTTGEAIWLSYNHYTFADILALKDHLHVESFLFHRQDSIDEKKVVPMFIDQPFILSTQIDRNVSPPCEYQWFRYVDGTSDEPLNQPSVDGHTLELETLTRSHDGTKYYYKVYHSSMPGITLVSNIQTVMAIAGNSLCIQYNPLGTFTFTANESRNRSSLEEYIAKERKTLSHHDIQVLLDQRVLDSISADRQLRESFTVQFTPEEKNYKVNYYDPAGNLVRSVANGQVRPLSMADIDNVVTGHKMFKMHDNGILYKYNSYNQVTEKMEDGARALYGYSKTGLLRFTQDHLQNDSDRYTYFRYDAQHRVIESGEIQTKSSPEKMLGDIEDIQFPGARKEELYKVTTNIYDDDSLLYSFSRGYIVRKMWREKEKDNLSVASYSYDDNGFVSFYHLYDKGKEDVSIAYHHEPLSGNIRYQFYQPGSSEEFIQYFSYNAAGNLRQVSSSTDGFIWNDEANYSYYPHGPLKYVIIGEYDVHTLNHYYTVNGWSKGVNCEERSDSKANGTYIGSYTVGYFANDFKTTSGRRLHEQLSGTQMFNGEVAWCHYTSKDSIGLTTEVELGPERIIRGYNGDIVALYRMGKLVSRSVYGHAHLGSIVGRIGNGTRRLGTRQYIMRGHNEEPLVVISDNVNFHGQRSDVNIVTDGYEDTISSYQRQREWEQVKTTHK